MIPVPPAAPVLTPRQHEQALRARLIAGWASVGGFVLWLASELPGWLPQLSPLLSPRGQANLRAFAIGVGLLAAFFARSSGAGQIPVKPAETVPPPLIDEASISIGSR